MRKLFMKDDKVYLRHIIEAIESIEEYLKGFDYESFSQDKKTVDAVVRELQIIGEASGRLRAEFGNKHRDIPLRDIKDMRNVLIHEYFGVNVKIVWDTCRIDLPKLKETVKTALR